MKKLSFYKIVITCFLLISFVVKLNYAPYTLAIFDAKFWSCHPEKHPLKWAV